MKGKGIAAEDFHLEHYFAKYEFVAKYLLCCSDCESWTMKDLVEMADEECRSLWDNLALGYTETQGLPVLRNELTTFYASEKITSANILMFAGGEEAIFCALKTLLSAEDHAIVVAPCYQSVKSIPEAICYISLFDLDQSNHWDLDLEKLEQVIIPNKTKLILINFPNNPSGVTISPEKQQGLIALARKYDLWVFSDEIYTGIDRDDVVAPSMCTLYEKAISLGGVSKSYGLAGLRIGWIACQDLQAMHDIAENKHYLSICNSAPSEILAFIAVRERSKLWARNRAIVDHNLVVLREFLSRYPHLFSWNEPKGGCCGFMRVHADVNLNEIAETMAQKHGVLILPGDNFPVTPVNEDIVSHHMRVGFGRKNFPVALQKLEELIPLYFTPSKN